MNDLEYRRRQLPKLQDTVIDLEDLSSGVSIADLTLTDSRLDLANYRKSGADDLDAAPLGLYVVTLTADAEIPPGVIFCLYAEYDRARESEHGYPLAPHYLIHVSEDGSVLLPLTQTKRILGRMKRLCLGRETPDTTACNRFDKSTQGGKDCA